MHSPDSIVVTETDGNTRINYVLENVWNDLLLNFKEPVLVVKANPNVYKDGVTIVGYKLDGTPYPDRNEFTKKVAGFYENEDKNHTVEINFNYVFNSEFPQPSNFGTPQTAVLTVYKSDGSKRKEYTINYDGSSFKFSESLGNLGVDDFASVVIKGSNRIGDSSSQTREVVIDFLANSQDGIIVTTPESGKDARVLAGNVQTPVVIDPANPIESYKMQAIVSAFCF
jgi:hypothetical protein